MVTKLGLDRLTLGWGGDLMELPLEREQGQPAVKKRHLQDIMRIGFDQEAISFRKEEFDVHEN
ncbi:MAG: hypothetical protein WB919_06370 [Candidatus Sulfotelmatobacter sp.]